MHIKLIQWPTLGKETFDLDEEEPFQLKNK